MTKPAKQTRKRVKGGPRKRLSSLAGELAGHQRAQQQTARALLTMGAAIAIVVVLRNPRAWGDGELATMASYAGWAVLVIAAVLAFRANASMAERRGYCLGKYGATPAELADKTKD